MVQINFFLFQKHIYVKPIVPASPLGIWDSVLTKALHMVGARTTYFMVVVKNWYLNLKFSLSILVIILIKLHPHSLSDTPLSVPTRIVNLWFI